MDAENFGNIRSAVEQATDEERAEFYRLLFPDFLSVPAQEPDFTEQPNEDFCLARVVCKTDKKLGLDDTAEGERVGAELHKTYCAWGWPSKKGFVLHTRQCEKEPLKGEMFCKKCLAKSAKEGSPSKTQWYGVYGEVPPPTSHVRGSKWSNNGKDL
jgi:hypothetical protein